MNQWLTNPNVFSNFLFFSNRLSFLRDSSFQWNFAAQTVSRKDVVLISLIDMDKPSCQVVVNCENVAFASILCREMCDSLEQ